MPLVHALHGLGAKLARLTCETFADQGAARSRDHRVFVAAAGWSGNAQNSGRMAGGAEPQIPASVVGKPSTLGPIGGLGAAPARHRSCGHHRCCLEGPCLQPTRCAPRPTPTLACEFWHTGYVGSGCCLNPWPPSPSAALSSAAPCCWQPLAGPLHALAAISPPLWCLGGQHAPCITGRGTLPWPPPTPPAAATC